MKHLDVRFTGLEYYLLAKALFLTVIDKHFPRSSVSEAAEEKEVGEVEAGDDSQSQPGF